MDMRLLPESAQMRVSKKVGETMSMLSSQADELREMADELRHIHVDDSSVGLLFAALGAMREAADTIEKLGPHSDQLEPSRWHELFGTPERAARTWIECNGIYHCIDCPICHDERGVTCEIPGECVWEDEVHGYDALLEWLRGDA